MSREVEISSLDLRYERLRMKNRTQEGRLLSSIAERGIEEPVEGVDTQGVRVLLNGFKRCRCARKLGIATLPYTSLGEDEVWARELFDGLFVTINDGFRARIVTLRDGLSG